MALAEETESETESSESIDPYTCLESDAILAALEEYSENPPEVAEVEIEEESTIDYDLGDDDDDDDDTEDGGEEGEPASDGAVDVGAAMEELDSFITALEGTGGDWTRALPCDDTFCITL